VEGEIAGRSTGLFAVEFTDRPNMTVTRTLPNLRDELALRLGGKRDEIEQALLARIYGIEEPVGVDPEYLHGLRATVTAAVDYALAMLQLGADRAPAVPIVLLTQARLAARNGISLDVVMRRYFSGFMLLADFLLAEAEAGEFGRHSLQEIMHSHGSQVDRLIDTIAEEYKRELPTGHRSSGQRRTERVKRVIAGEMADLIEFGYNLDGWHLGLILKNSPKDFVRRLASAFDRRLLYVSPEPDVIWAWLGGSEKLECGAAAKAVSAWGNSPVQVAIGEPASGTAGFRLTHHQAKAAMPMAKPGLEEVTRHASVGLVACVLKDEVLSRSLVRRFVEPLGDERDGGAAIRETLRAYFSTGRNITAAAALLRLNRQTVRNRLRTYEGKIGCCLDQRGAEAEVALRVAEQRAWGT
jgi:hypothetical protein